MSGEIPLQGIETAFFQDKADKCCLGSDFFKPMNVILCPHISSSSESFEIRSFSMADLIMPTSVVEGFRSSAVEK